VNKLREIQLSEIRQLRFYGAADAQQRFGTGHAGGVIDVSTGAVAPTGTVVSDRRPHRRLRHPQRLDARPRDASVASPDNSNVLKAEEFEGSTAIDVMALVQEFRPTWLHSRGVTSIPRSECRPGARLPERRLAGDVNQCARFASAIVKELRFLPAAQAHARYGVGHEGGVIEVSTR